MRATKLALLGAFLVLIAVVFAATAVFAFDYSGNNAWTRYRLPWQHGQWHYMSQGYNQGNHANWSGQYYSLDFPMNNGSPVLAITEGSGCVVLEPNGSGLGKYVVQTAPAAPGHTATPTDFYFYGHNSSTWMPECGVSSAFLYQSQIAAWSGNTPTPYTPFHLHITVQNPGHICYCDPNYLGQHLSVMFSPLSGIDFNGHTGYAHTYTSDSVMAGDDNTLPEPNPYPAIFTNWNNNGRLNGPGSTRDAGAGPGVHLWWNGYSGNYGYTQDFIGPGGTSAIMQRAGFNDAFWVQGAIWSTYLGQGGGPGWLGYPTTNEFQYGPWRRSEFQGGYICWQPNDTNYYAWGQAPPGNACSASVKAIITSPAPGSVLPASYVWFTRNNGEDVAAYSLWAGTALGSYDIFAGYMSAPSLFVTGIPTNGWPVYVRLWSYFNSCGCWQYNDYTYTAAFIQAQLISPPNGITLHGTSATFTRQSVGAASYSLWVGTAPASYNITAQYMTSPSLLVTGLPANNSYIYVRLWSYFTVCGCWLYYDYYYYSSP